jgi:hypothetical protein
MAVPEHDLRGLRRSRRSSRAHAERHGSGRLPFAENIGTTDRMCIRIFFPSGRRAARGPLQPADLFFCGAVAA